MSSKTRPVPKPITRHEVKTIEGIVNQIKSPVFIVSGGKTGSMTLSKSYPDSFHCHTTLCLNHDLFPKAEGVTLLQLYSKAAEKFKQPAIIITSVRNPLDRMIGSFFQHLEGHLKMSRKEILQMDPIELVEIFNQQFLHLEGYYPFLLSDTCDLDLLSVPFDQTQKYIRIESSNQSKILVAVRFEDIANWKRILSIALPERKEFNYQSDNLSKDKWYSNLYLKFKENFKIRKEDLDQIFDHSIHTRVLQHFYTAEEIDRMKSKYTII
jgi:hypothetical protein